MRYVLKQFDTPILTFTASEGADSDIHFEAVCEPSRDLLPLDLELSEDGLLRWLRRRTIPKNRAYVQSFLSKCGLSINRPLDIIRFSKGLALNDSYWVVEEGFQGVFDQYNLFENPFSRILAEIAFTGCGSSSRSTFASSPEFTTQGMLPKCWRRIDGHVTLYKGGTRGAANTGFEPYSEFYAAQIAGFMGFDHVDYGLSRWKGELCSTCRIFTDKGRSYIPAGHLVRAGGIKAVREYYASLGPDFVKAMDDMIILDALIWNTDRHFDNFGLLIDNQTNRVDAPAPLFDHGNSLFNYAGRDDLESVKDLIKYAQTLLPVTYDDYMAEAAGVLRQDHREGLRKILGFRFRKHPRYNLPDDRLRLIEQLLRQRAQELLAN